MVIDPSFSDTETLGHFLQRQRTEKGVDLLEVAEETKIPPGTLGAMESGEYSALPADAFARGFFSIYARLLELDVDSILERYTTERGLSQNNQKITETPSKLGDSVGPMAERPSATPLSVAGFILVIIILAITGICWYLSWNPATFLSERLRSFGKKPAVEQKNETSRSSASNASPNEATKPLPPEPIVNGKAPADGQNAASSNTSKYTLQAEFQEPTKVTVTIDEEFPEALSFSAGQTLNWHAKGSIILALPSTTKTRLTLNGVAIPLPEPVDGFITVSIPGSLP